MSSKKLHGLTHLPSFVIAVKRAARPRGERGGRGRGRGRARGGGRQHVVLNLGSGARGRGAGGGMMQAIGEVGAEVTAPPRRVRPRPDSMDDDQLLDGVEGI